MYTVYVLKSLKDKKLYIGCTQNLKIRFDKHNKGYVKSTKSRRPLEVIYEEIYDDKYEAYNVERYYKTARGKQDLKGKISYLPKGPIV